ncbi:hypothetical protein EDD29_6595 [Actinocorallia herbida]|uniref:Uncharacterized protein n=1 Tax=Actinocorallia herbida TaxID=58109 RepID=A0A3N1D5X4_9ACTN|nr:hypothetical protein [Actinocorallia herbida]ROO88910.1 hypothetical protein EDD29_6595 [Actinocorallia herbida]
MGHRFGLVAVFGFLLLWPGDAAAWDAAKDAQLVFCLSGDHRQGLADAAGILGLAEPRGTRVVVGGRELSLEEWREKKPTDFERACAALVSASAETPAAGKADSPFSLAALAAVLVPVVVGAGLAWSASEWRASVDAGRAKADEFRAAARAFTESVRAYVQEELRYTVGRRPDADAVDRDRMSLDTWLQRVALAEPKWRMVQDLRAALGGDLGEILSEGWDEPGGAQEKTGRAKRIEADLAVLEEGCERIALALERPGRLHSGLKRDAGTRT